MASFAADLRVVAAFGQIDEAARRVKLRFLCAPLASDGEVIGVMATV